MKSEIIIIGGGASALMLASLLPENSVKVIERNQVLGAKIAVSGGGKCNITNIQMGSEYFLARDDFVKPALKRFSQNALLAWLKRDNLSIVVRKHRQYFCEHSALDLVGLFVKKLKRQKVHLGEKVLGVVKKGDYFIVDTDRGSYSSKYVVVASGGLSFPRLGASGIGYEIAESFGHSLADRAPALVGLTLQKEQFFFKELSGVSCETAIRVGDCICEGKMLFAHRGISGPAVLDASLYWKKGYIEIDFLPHFSLNSLKGSKKQISTLLPLPKRITKALLVQLGIKDKAFISLREDESRRLRVFHHYRLSPSGTFGYSKAEVTRGGVSTEEIDSETMMSQRVDGLYFVGEVLDVTGRLGGYNFQWAFSSAFSCAQSIKNIMDTRKL